MDAMKSWRGGTWRGAPRVCTGSIGWSAGQGINEQSRKAIIPKHQIKTPAPPSFYWSRLVAVFVDQVQVLCF